MGCVSGRGCLFLAVSSAAVFVVFVIRTNPFSVQNSRILLLLLSGVLLSSQAHHHLLRGRILQPHGTLVHSILCDCDVICISIEYLEPFHSLPHAWAGDPDLG